ncbi:MAG: phenylacetate-CoA oxygenase subunit PaaJ [Betaproteobacteria bacterium]|nr:phenylacetate-CoA oxygenase subunit PaaJ [Betaproteobacteria bacterium]MBU6511316.1 phenylacetate-CoA oxygenase subunit PaaJ [Betaproteobacteria bacterium]MDE1954487.1 phenylacetate-CoA oxygenase subunit PaaJ [Betaproteobacteria bacterium]MDE2151258.1 phenylacetate-CoA oxygenase subunit PaaJ [Betaproteobacteria bacterium]MDE2479362.1 phenylacetate-CoA oxygenase subunit PaaJ [Betaproteobacteria bacterium]
MNSTAQAGARAGRAWQVLAGVPDPEIPAVSVCELGIVRDVSEGEDGALQVVLTPTYSGCPATEMIERDVRQALLEAGLGPVRTELRRAPAWTTDWISEDGRRKLREYGIAPPPACASAQAAPAAGGEVFVLPRRDAPACPRCGSSHTAQIAGFGSTPCKALWRCLDCAEPFDYFKPF